MKNSWLVFLLGMFLALPALPQNSDTGQIQGVVKDPDQAVIAGARVVLTNTATKSQSTGQTDRQGAYSFSSLPPGSYLVEVQAAGFRPAASAELKLAAGQTLAFDAVLALAEHLESVVVSGSSENAYRVDYVQPGGPLGNTPILDLPYSVYVISRQLIDDTQSRNFKEAVKYLPVAGYQEMQGPEVLRPESRGMQGSNMQNDLKDGMGIAVTTPTALEEYEQIEVITGVAAPLYGPANPSGMFNFITKRPTETQFRELELSYEGSAVGTAHLDLGGRLGPNNKMFGYRTNLVIADGTSYVPDSELRRQLAAIALDVRPAPDTVIEGNFSYYNLHQFGDPGWFAYTPTLTSTGAPSASYILLPANAPDPSRPGYGQSFAGADLTNQIGEVRVKHTFSRNWQLIAGVLHQTADRLISTPVNSLYNNAGGYHSYLEDVFQNTLAPRFQVKSDLAYLTGSFQTWGVSHAVVIGTNGYRFATYQPVVSPLNASLSETPLCRAGDHVSGANCLNAANMVDNPSVADPILDVPPAAGIPSYKKTEPYNGIYVNNIIHQQGFSLDDTVTLTPHWLLRAAASQDWTWVNTYKDSSGTNYMREVNSAVAHNVYQGVSPTGSILYKPRMNMTIYGTFADSIQAPDVAATSNFNAAGTLCTSFPCIVNSGQQIPPYRSLEGEAGYKLELRRINFSTAFFRIERPFANYVTGISSPLCGADSGTANCEIYKIVGNQINYGVEAVLSGRIFESLMLTGGLVALNPKLTDTPYATTNNRDFVGIPAYKSNILAEYRLPKLRGLYFNFDWQHVGRRPIDDINSRYTPQFNTFDLGLRYSRRILGKRATWLVTANNVTDVHFWSTLGPGSITGTSTGSYLGHLGEPRLVTAAMRYEF